MFASLAGTGHPSSPGTSLCSERQTIRVLIALMLLRKVIKIYQPMKKTTVSWTSEVNHSGNLLSLNLEAVFAYSIPGGPQLRNDRRLKKTEEFRSLITRLSHRKGAVAFGIWNFTSRVETSSCTSNVILGSCVRCSKFIIALVFYHKVITYTLNISLLPRAILNNALFTCLPHIKCGRLSRSIDLISIWRIIMEIFVEE